MFSGPSGRSRQVSRRRIPGHVRAAAALVASLLAACGASDDVPKAVLAPGIDALDLQVTAEHTLVAVQRDGTAVEIDAQGATKRLSATPEVTLYTGGRVEGVERPLIDLAVRQDGTVFYLHGDPARISREDGTRVADVPGARAIVFGNGGGLDPAHLYVAEKDAISLIRPD